MQENSCDYSFFWYDKDKMSDDEKNKLQKSQTEKEGIRNAKAKIACGTYI